MSDEPPAIRIEFDLSRRDIVALVRHCLARLALGRWVLPALPAPILLLVTASWWLGDLPSWGTHVLMVAYGGFALFAADRLLLAPHRSVRSYVRECGDRNPIGRTTVTVTSQAIVVQEPSNRIEVTWHEVTGLLVTGKRIFLAFDEHIVIIPRRAFSTWRAYGQCIEAVECFARNPGGLPPRCPRCGYDLRGAAELRCSECGWRPTGATFPEVRFPPLGEE